LIGAEFSQGLKELSAFLRDDVATRPNTKKDFRKITGVLSRTQPIVDNLVLRLLLNGQYAYDALLSSEEFGFGGRNMGLAYDAYAISGDRGIGGKVELAYDIPFGSIIDSLGCDRNINSTLGLNVELFGYYDSGKVWNIHHIVSGQPATYSATSGGGGLRGSVLKYLVYEAYVAKPINRIVDNEQNKKRRGFYSVGFSYPF
jgi:hemolysin activation/secretion protein